jgi:hypothetical protein
MRGEILNDEKKRAEFVSLGKIIQWPERRGGSMKMFPNRIRSHDWSFPISGDVNIGGTEYKKGEKYKIASGICREIDGQWWIVALRFNERMLPSSSVRD